MYVYVQHFVSYHCIHIVARHCQTRKLSIKQTKNINYCKAKIMLTKIKIKLTEAVRIETQNQRQNTAKHRKDPSNPFNATQPLLYNQLK